MPIGTLISKIRCQLFSTRKPPSNGPNEIEAAAATDQRPRATPRCRGGNSRVTMASPSDWIMPLPTPCNARAAIRKPSVPARPQSHDPNVKITIPPK